MGQRGSHEQARARGEREREKARERERGRETHDEGAERRLRVDVHGRAPILGEDTLLDLPELGPKRDGELGVGPLVLLRLVDDLGVGGELTQLLLNGRTLGAIEPRLMPVDVGMRAGCGADDLEHELGGVDAGRELGRAVALEVLAQDVRALANGIEVDGFSAACEE